MRPDNAGLRSNSKPLPRIVGVRPRQDAADRKHVGPAFVPAPLISDAPRLITAHALHRGASGLPRPDCSASCLARALASGEVVCDPLVVRWAPPFSRADRIMRNAWGGRTGHESDAHRQLRIIGSALLAAWTGGANVEPEKPLYRADRSIRPDLVASSRRGYLIALEAGAVDGDTVYSLLMPHAGSRTRRVRYVVVLPFAGQDATTTQGYVFRLATAPALRTPDGPDPANWSMGDATFSGTLTLGGGCHEAEAVQR
jgi:hypothetical protein